jgi:methylenetetrahydrofolate dehydrogenase (NADP+)/methenyltetrahydrofolate cyclohydrolase
MLEGAPVALALNEKLAVRVRALRARKTVPTLAIVRVGEAPGDIAYQSSAAGRCKAVGAEVRPIELPGGVSQEQLTQTLRRLNGDAAVQGILLLRPLPAGMDDAAVRNSLLPEKDVDGITDVSLAGVFTAANAGFAPCTAAACIELLDYYGVCLPGKRVVVVGRSLVVGKPLAMMLLNRNATVTICHTKTQSLAEICKAAEILVVSAGCAGMADKTFLSPGQTVLDVGIHVSREGKVVGDVNLSDARAMVQAVTPVPGGVGGVTVSVLAAHVVAAAERQSAAPKRDAIPTES